jgi:hypothetical protein
VSVVKRFLPYRLVIMVNGQITARPVPDDGGFALRSCVTQQEALQDIEFYGSPASGELYRIEEVWEVVEPDTKRTTP